MTPGGPSSRTPAGYLGRAGTQAPCVCVRIPAHAFGFETIDGHGRRLRAGTVSAFDPRVTERRRCVLAGHAHSPVALLVPPMHFVGATCAGIGFATQLPSLNSCRGKHFPSTGTHSRFFSTSPAGHAGTAPCSDCANAGTAMKRNQQIAIMAAAEKRVIIKPLCHLQNRAQNNPNHRAFARQGHHSLLRFIGAATRHRGAFPLKLQGLPQRRERDKTAH